MDAACRSAGANARTKSLGNDLSCIAVLGSRSVSVVTGCCVLVQRRLGSADNQLTGTPLPRSFKIYSCNGMGAVECSVASSLPVTEIFRYQGGRWVY